MGMFDEITVTHDLPLPEELKSLTTIDWKSHKFQTKDFVNCMVDYLIDQGFLYERVVEREYLPYTEEEKKHKDHKAWNLWKEVIETSIEYKKMDYHGSIRFYTYEPLDDKHDFWIDFQAFFTYGKLDKIELIEFNKDKSNKTSLSEWTEKQRKLEAKLSYKIKKYSGFFLAATKLSNVAYMMSHVFQNIQMTLNRSRR
jgi:hypothetical protein